MAEHEGAHVGTAQGGMGGPSTFATGENAMSVDRTSSIGFGNASASDSSSQQTNSASVDGQSNNTLSTHTSINADLDERVASEASKKKSLGQEDDDAQIETADGLLKHVHAAKLLRLFKTRLELAAFKSRKGWFEAPFSKIEEFCDAEAIARRQAADYSSSQQQVPIDGTYPGGAPHAAAAHHQQIDPSLSQAGFGNDASYSHQQPEGSMGPPMNMAQKRGRISNPMQASSSSSSSSSASPYNQPVVSQTHFGGMYANAPHLQYGGPSTEDAHRAKRRMLDTQFQQNAVAQQQDPAKQGNGGRQQDSTFDSFVGAANVLSGLSRGPSADSAPGRTAPEPERPHTPPRGPTSKSPFKNTTDNDPANAAELMLLFAASPSPVRTRTNTSSMPDGGLGGNGMKGRRLFANDGGSPRERTVSEAFGGLHHGGQVNGHASELDDPSNFDFNATFVDHPGDMHHHHHEQQHHQNNSQQQHHLHNHHQAQSQSNDQRHRNDSRTPFSNGPDALDEGPTTPSRNGRYLNASASSTSQQQQQHQQPHSSQGSQNEPWNDFLSVPQSPERRSHNPAGSDMNGRVGRSEAAASAW